MKQRILLALSNLFAIRGGIPRFNQMLCLALDDLSPELGLEVQVVTQGETLEDYSRAAEPWKHLEFVPGGNKLAVMRKTFSLSMSRRPDLLLLGLIGMTPVGPACLPFLSRGFGFVAHGFECWRGNAMCETRRSRLAAARRASFVFAVSRFTGRELCDLTGLSARSIMLLPNTLEPSFMGYEEARPDETDEPVSELLSVSRLWSTENMKGVDHTIRAFAKLATAHPGAHYRIVGKGDDKQRLQRLAVSLGVGHRVTFEQDLSDEELAARYRRCAAFVLPSGQEGFGIVFLEAMRFAKACVGGDHGGTPEVIVDGETGYLVPFGDEAALAAVLGRLLAAPELRRELGRAGYARLIEQFTFEKFRERLAEHLRELLVLD